MCPVQSCRLQSKCRSRLEERLAQDWRRAFSEQLVDSVQDIYDFFQSDAHLFASSALFRLLKHLELRMSSHLRILLTVRACRGYRYFIFVSRWWGVLRPCFVYVETKYEPTAAFNHFRIILAISEKVVVL